MKNPFYNRRTFLRNSGILMAAGALISPFELLGSGMARQGQNPKRLGIALVGLGNYSKNQLAPALQETKHCYLAGIVTGTPSKAEEWKKKYDIPDKNVYNYENFDTIADNDDIDIIYVVLPNGMHAEYTIRAAKAGKHVICEKPMAISVEECQQMIDACKENNVKLSIGYRLHFEPHHLRVMELGQHEVFGKVKTIDTSDAFVLNDPNVWRVDKQLSGGGAIMDLGIYTVQGACYTMGSSPVEIISAEYGEITKPEIFDEVEQSLTWKMRFANGAESSHFTSYADEGNLLAATAENGWWKLQPSYGYSGQKGEISKGTLDFPEINQQAYQMDDFAKCVLDDIDTIVPGEMGKRDVEIIMAVYEAANSGKSVSLNIDDSKIPYYDEHVAVRK